ncbi:hypothetical protein Hanom_Chr06g00579171 [Helianthus anomalus]
MNNDAYSFTSDNMIRCIEYTIITRSTSCGNRIIWSHPTLHITKGKTSAYFHKIICNKVTNYQIHCKNCRTHVSGCKWDTKRIHLLVRNPQCLNRILKYLDKKNYLQRPLKNIIRN